MRKQWGGMVHSELVYRNESAAWLRRKWQFLKDPVGKNLKFLKCGERDIPIKQDKEKGVSTFPLT